MPAAPDPDLSRLQMIVHLAGLIRTELDRMTRDEFLEHQNQIDLTSYRLGSIGEYGKKLSPELKERYPTMNWRGMYNMRNALFHDYEGVLASQVWAAAGAPLAQLVEVCVIEINRRSA